MIRPGTPQDARFLRDMLRHAYYWRSGQDEDETGLHPMRYVENWGRPGDAGVMALYEGSAVGASGYRQFKQSTPGYHAISLSVASDSPAVHLYERYGFEKVDERDGAWTMRATF